MSEAVQLALIATVHDWFSSLISNAGPVVAAVVAFATFVAQMYTRWQDKREHRAATAAREDLASKIDANTEMTQAVQVAAVRGKDEVERAALGGERKGAVAALDAERKRVSGFNPLSTDIVDVSKP